MTQIADIDLLLQPQIAPHRILSLHSRNLIAPGENYGSIMLALDVHTSKPQTLNLVAKLCPPTDFIKKMFNIPITYKKEVAMYAEVIPALQQYLVETGTGKYNYDFFPEYFGSRLCLNHGETVTDDACLLLENVKTKGFEIGDRLQGLSLEVAEVIIKDLAVFHAVPIALKLKHRRLFEEKVMRNLVKHMEEDTISEEMDKAMRQAIVEGCLKNKECEQYLGRVEEAMKRNSVNFKGQSCKVEEPWGTIVHSDLWVNNTMQKTDEIAGIRNVFVDFQLVVYGNPAHDLVFFIYSSLHHEIISHHYDRLIRLYHSTFLDVLNDLQTPNVEQFSLEGFLGQIEAAARELQFYHVLFMLKPIFSDKDKAKELSDVNENEITNAEGVSEGYYPKLWSTVLDFVDKGWI